MRAARANVVRSAAISSTVGERAIDIPIGAGIGEAASARARLDTELATGMA